MTNNYKKWLAILIFIFSANYAFGQEPDRIIVDLKRSEEVVEAIEAVKDPVLLQQVLDATKQMFDWNVQENKGAYMMSVDIPYPNIQNPKDYFSITVVKFKGEKRPRVISFAVSSMIDPSKGLSIYFVRYDKKKSFQISNIKFENTPFTEVNSEYIKVSAENMFLDKEEKKDLFEPMLNNNDSIIFQYYDNDGQLYKVSYPLSWFKDKIEELK